MKMRFNYVRLFVIPMFILGIVILFALISEPYSKQFKILSQISVLISAFLIINLILVKILNKNILVLVYSDLQKYIYHNKSLDILRIENVLLLKIEETLNETAIVSEYRVYNNTSKTIRFISLWAIIFYSKLKII